MRKPVAAVVTTAGSVVVVCEDGSVWLAMTIGRGPEGEWLKQRPIPGSEADPTSGE